MYDKGKATPSNQKSSTVDPASDPDVIEVAEPDEQQQSPEAAARSNKRLSTQQLMNEIDFQGKLVVIARAYNDDDAPRLTPPSGTLTTFATTLSRCPRSHSSLDGALTSLCPSLSPSSSRA